VRLQPGGRRQALSRVAVAVLGPAVAIAAAAAPGRAHDSLAPPGREHTWLPSQEWVAGHWIPFEEQALKRALGLRGRDLESYLYDDHHTLAYLARRRRIVPAQLAERLIDPWRPRASEASMARLRDHTLRILTQGHLAQHVFYHVFHGVPVVANAQSVFGVPGRRYRRLRERGWRPLRIAHRGGVTFRAVRRGMIRLLRAQREEGIRDRLAWAPESARIFRRQVRALTCWLRRTMPENDPGNPYGKARHQHGSHAREWPATPGQRRRNERRVERVRRSLHRSCWSPPPAWRWR
jgi:hypothetical protein